jgi:uncharacterized protein YuzE
MTFEYFSDTDTLYIAFRPGPGADAAEVGPDVIFDYDAQGNVIGLTVEHASKRADISSFSVLRIPPLAASLGGP